MSDTRCMHGRTPASRTANPCPGPECAVPAPLKGSMAPIVHAATDDGTGHCPTCGQRVRPIADGKHVHPDGHVAARTPAAVLAARTLVADWQQASDNTRPGGNDRPDDYILDTDDIEAEAYADIYEECAHALASILDPAIERS
jgi:hypothetical protein